MGQYPLYTPTIKERDIGPWTTKLTNSRILISAYLAIPTNEMNKTSWHMMLINGYHM